MDTKALGHIIRNFRKSHKYTQAYVASMCGIGTRFLIELEKGKETAEVGLVLKVLWTLGLDILVTPRTERNTPEFRKLKEVMDGLQHS